MWPAVIAEVATKPLDWVFQKKHKTHFWSRKNASTSLPKTTNTPGLYDGSAEALAILGPIFEGDITEEGAGVRRHALDYLKGKNVNHLGMWTREILGEELDELTPEDFEAIQNMVMDRSAVVGDETEEGQAFFQLLKDKATSVTEELVQIAPLTFPDKPCGPVEDAVFDNENFPSWNPNSGEPL